MSRHVRNRDEFERGSKWFSDWHRDQPDDDAGMIDLDGVGYCRKCSMPLYLVEATKSRTRKCAAITERLGQLAGLEVFVFYLDDKRADGFWVDWRSAGTHLGFKTHAAAWDLLVSVRRTHAQVCVRTRRKEKEPT